MASITENLREGPVRWIRPAPEVLKVPEAANHATQELAEAIPVDPPTTVKSPADLTKAWLEEAWRHGVVDVDYDSEVSLRKPTTGRLDIIKLGIKHFKNAIMPGRPRK